MFEAIHPPAEPTNEQPWRFLVARRNDPTEFERLLSCIAPANHASAMEAPVLVLSIVTLNFSKSDGRNHAALRDLGLACANLAMAALVRGYSVHQIMGIFPERVRDLYRVPECFAAWTSMAIGYQENTHSLPAVLPQRETTTQGQHRASQFVFTGSWGQPSFQAARS